MSNSKRLTFFYQPVRFKVACCLFSLTLIGSVFADDVFDSGNNYSGNSSVNGRLSGGRNFNDLQQLKRIEAQVRSVVSRNLDSCVAIADGTGFGSGVIVSPDGLILTAGHVMSTKGPYDVILPSGRTVRARPLGKNLNVDSGMIQLDEPGPWPYVEIADLPPASLRTDPLVGQWVVCLGHSGGFELGRLPPVRTGRVLARRGHQVVTDAVLIGGDSGGPLFDLDGKLIAIHSSIGDTIAENRHVTVDIFRRDWDRLVNAESWGRLPGLQEPGEKKQPGKIGVVVDRTTPSAVVNSVREGSSAYEAGIMAGDVVVSFNRIRIKDGDHLIEIVKRYNAGQVLPIEISRNGRMLKFDIQLQ